MMSGSVARARPKGEERRRSILAIAVRLFADGGFNAVSLADIAAEVRITQAGILHHFPTKAALLLAVLREREQQNAEALRHHVAAGEDALTAYIATLRENDLQPELVKLFVVLSAESASTGHPSHEWFRSRNAEALARLTTDLSSSLDEALLPPRVSPEVLARWILALSHGLGAQWVYDTDAFDRASLVDLFIEFLRPFLSHDRLDVEAAPDREGSTW